MTTTFSGQMSASCFAVLVMQVFLGLLLVSSGSSAEPDSRWGNLRGRFLFDGQPPPPKYRKVLKDVEVFGPRVLDETLRIHRDNRGIADIVIYLLPDAKRKLRVHPDYDKTAHSKVKLTIKGGRFEIRNLPVGRHVFRLWHERHGHIGDTEFGAYKSDRRGRLTIDVRGGDNDLPAVKLAPAGFDTDRR